MLGTLLDRLGGLFSKHFLIGAFFPVLLAVGANGFLAYAAAPRVRSLVGHIEALSAGRQGIVLAAGLVALAAAAYLFSATSPLLRELLEGKHWAPSMRIAFERGQRARRLEAEQRLERSRRARRALKLAARKWPDRLLEARAAGTSEDPPQAELEAARALLLGLKEQLEDGGPVSSAELGGLVDRIEGLLRRFKADTSAELDALHVETLTLMTTAQAAHDLEYLSRFTALRADFGDQLAPTRFGNIAATVQSYAVGRYNFNADAFWPSLERAMLKDADFHGLLQDARTELNFFVSVWWLTAASAVVWVPIAALCFSWKIFAVAAAAGPAVVELWYALAHRSYRNLATRLKSAIDLYRFDLLAALHVPIPDGLNAERETWERLNRLASFQEQVALSYKHPAP